MTVLYIYGGDASTWVFTMNPGGVVFAGANSVVQFYTAKTGGSLVAGLLDMGNNPISSVTCNGFGFPPQFQSPATAMWADSGAGFRVLVKPANSGSSLDADTAGNVNNPGSATAVALSGAYAPGGTAGNIGIGAVSAARSSLASNTLVSSLGLVPQLVDNFQRSDRNLEFDAGPNGLGYAVMRESTPGDSTTMNIVSGVCRRANKSASGSPILMAPLRDPARAIATEFSLVGPATTAPVGAIVGTCASFFGNGSIQIGVSQTGWQVFSYSGSAIIIDSGTFATPLTMDGVTRYRTLAWVDLAASTLTYSIPSGDGTLNNTTHTVTHARVATDWGGQFLCLQDNTNTNATDPDVIFYEMAAA